jgi:hypothetical protein
LLARAYPQASIDGYDFHDRSITIARQRAALASAARRARRKRGSPSAPRRPWPGQLQSWRAMLGTLACLIASPILGWFARAVRRACTPGRPAKGAPSWRGATRLIQTVASAGSGPSARSEEMGQAGRKPDDPVPVPPQYRPAAHEAGLPR